MQPSEAPAGASICEVNRTLMTYKGSYDDAARDTYGEILSRTYPQICLWNPEEQTQTEPQSHASSSWMLAESVNATSSQEQPGSSVPDGRPSEGDASSQLPVPSLTPGSLASSGVAAALQVAALYCGAAVRRVQLAAGVVPKEVPGVPGTSGKNRLGLLSWHARKQRLAALGTHDQILLFDFEPARPSASEATPTVLTHELQRQVAALAWRPNSGAAIAVACREGICLWTLASPVSIAPHPRAATPSRMLRSPANANMAFLANQGSGHVTTLAWSPDGRLLAAASDQSPTITIWDVGNEVATPVRRGLGGIALLSWSPAGDYLVAGNTGQAFHLWETDSWTSEAWSSNSGVIADATWSPDGRVLLAAFQGAAVLAAIHLARGPPSLDAHLLPLQLPDVAAIKAAGGIEHMAWDGMGERLALSFRGGDNLTRGQIALYDTRRVPIISAAFIGFINGPDDSVVPVAMAFHCRFQRGALLAVSWSNGQCIIYPLIFRGVRNNY